MQDVLPQSKSLRCWRVEVDAPKYPDGVLLNVRALENLLDNKSIGVFPICEGCLDDADLRVNLDCSGRTSRL